MGMVDDYLAALAANDPQRLPWSARAGYTENAAALRVSEGLWATATRIGTFRLVFADPAQSSVAFFGTVLENGSPVILGLRLRIEGHRIVEAEHIVMRDASAARRFAARAEDPLMAVRAAQGRRASRAELAAAAEAYFDGIEAISAANIPFAKNCNRIENGRQTTNVTDLANGPFLELASPSWRAVLAQGCAGSIDSGANAHITQVRARRTVVIDEAASTAVAAVIFDHAGTIATTHLPGQPEIAFPQQLRQPFDTLVLEAFKLDADKQIVRVEAVGTVLPLGTLSGWEK